MKIRRGSLIFLAFAAVFFINSCGSKTATTEYGEVELLSPKKVVEKSEVNFPTPEYLSATLKIKYKSNNAKSSFTAKLRMEKDKQIWVNISFLGISFARGIITPEGVSMYERQNGTYFKGDFEYLSELLGAELDFYQIQALLLGNPLQEIRTNKYETLLSKNSLLLEYDNNRKLTKRGVNNGDYIRRYWYNPVNFELERQMLALPDRSTTLIVKNERFKSINKKYKIPNDINLQIINGKSTIVDVEYKGIKVDNKLSFPFRIPKGYKEVEIKTN
ncbi:MAG: DUF4292 domain-containing protein [Bacteroidota bacterium]